MIYRFFSWFLILFACLYGIGSYPLLDNNEGLYGAIARDMVAHGQYIIPHLNHMPYIEKPPMLYWLLAASMSLFGVNEAAVHLVPALALLMTAWLSQRFVRRNTGSEAAGFTAALILVTALPVLTMARMVLCDMIMTAFLSAALMEFYDWHHSGNKRRLIAMYALLALGVLTKGFVVLVLAGGTIGSFMLWQRSPWRRYLQVLSPIGILSFIAIAAPWHIAASLQEPGFAWFYFINEHVMRFLNKRQPHDYYTGPLWYYLPRVLGYLMPWSPFLLLLCRRPAASGDQTLRQFLWSWFLFCLVFFSVSGAKANYYMIAGIPAIAMLLALHIRHYTDSNPRPLRALATISMVLILAALWCARFFCNATSGDLYTTCEVISAPLLGSMVVYAVAVVALCWCVPVRWLAPAMGANVVLLLPLLIAGTHIADGRVSQKATADFLKASGYGEVAVYQEFEELSALAFYLDKPLLIVDSTSSDLLYGQHQPAGKPYFLTLKEWAAHEPELPLVLMKQRMNTVIGYLHAMNAGNICVLHRSDRVAILAKCQ